jgi:putative addiction module component (TIGR02574 family)
MSASEIIAAIKQMPPAERKKVFRFVEKLRDAQIKKEWDKEIARRLEEIDSGKVKLIPAEKVFAKLRAKYG